MRSRVKHLALLGFMVCVLPICSISGQKTSLLLAGDYAGVLGQLHLALHIQQDPAGVLTGTLDSVDQRANAIPCVHLALSGTQFSFKVPAVHGTYKGEASIDGNTITGAWNQGASMPLIFVRQTAVPGTEKQMAPKLTFEFAGKLRTYYSFVPDGEVPLPLVVLLHGSGRNGQVMVDAWRDLASEEHFIVVAPDSYDPAGRGVKMDSPEFLRAVVEQVKPRHAVDESRIYLFGHSAGAVHALVISIIDSQFYAATAVHAGALPPGYEKQLFSRADRRLPIAIWVGAEDPLFSVAAVTETKRLMEQNGFQVQLSVIPNHDHNYYAISDQVNSSAWDFLKKAQWKRQATTPSQAVPQHSAHPSSFLEFPLQKLKEAVPGLMGLNYDASQDRLPIVLAGVAQTIANMLPRLPDLASREQI